MFKHYVVSGWFRDQYEDIVHSVWSAGRRVAPRGIETVEVTACLEFRDPTKLLLTGINRSMSTKLAAVETLQLIGGFHDPARLVEATPNFTEFLDGGSQRGAYGPRVGWQVEQCRRQLKEDPGTRRAIVQIWDVSDLPALISNDYPCTLSLHFLLRDHALEMHVTMRSNDLWRGTTYDVIMFSQLQCTLASLLGVRVGTYYHHVDSLHIYESDRAKADELLHPAGDPVSLCGLFDGASCQGLSWEAVMRLARELHYGQVYVEEATARWLGSRAQ
jgi:thymidylate synthase